MVTIAVIGAGQLGSRHLQALRLLDLDAQVHAVDPSPESLERARHRVAEVAATRDNPFDFHTAIDDLPGSIDLAVVASSADRRLEILEALLRRRSVANLILEKVLFQRAREYARGREILAEHGARAWVNCPRRMMPVFRALAAYFEADQPVELRVTGENWGLGCNAIHCIDHLAMYVGRGECSVDASGLDARILDSKRPGFVEFTGSLAGELSGSGRFELSCAEGDAFRQTTVIEGAGTRIEFSIPGDTVSIRDERTGAVKSMALELPPQSRLTHLAAAEILLDARTALPTYEESAALHLPMIRALGRHIERITGEAPDRVPIT